MLTILVTEAHDLLKEQILNRQHLRTLAESLEEKVKVVKSLDEGIMETCKVEDIKHKIGEPYEFNERAMET